jgi:hypothetical protein
MTLETVFSAVSTLSFFSWIGLWLFYKKSETYTYLFSLVLITFAIVYAYFIFTGFSLSAMENFQSLEGIRALFSSDEALLAGWIHYLAFDLFVGMWIAKDAANHEESRWVVLPFLLFTFMMGPLGLLFYFLYQAWKMKKFLKTPFS